MRDIALARLTGGRVHFQHLSTRRSVDLVRGGQGRGPARSPARRRRTTSRSPTTRCAGFDPVFKVNPPLRHRRRRGRGQGRAGRRARSTASPPTTPRTRPRRRSSPSTRRRPGMLGLETALALALTHLDLPAGRGAGAAVVASGRGRSASTTPTAARSTEGRPANLCVVDPQATWTVDPGPWPAAAATPRTRAWSCTGRVRHTVLRRRAGRASTARRNGRECTAVHDSCTTLGEPPMTVREGLLVLADGTTFEGELIGADARRGHRHRRGRVQHGAVRLPGGAVTDPQLRRADHHLHLPAHRQLRGQRRRRREPAAVLPGRGRPRPGPPAIATGARPTTSTPTCAGTASPASPGSTPAASPGTSATRAPCPARSAPADEVALKAAARGRAGHRRRRPGRHRDLRRAVHRGGDGPAASAAHRGLRLRHQAHDPAPPVGPRRGRRSCPPPRPPTRCWPATPTACSSPTAPATRRRSPTPSRPITGLRRPRCRSSASASATSCWPPPSGPPRTSCRSVTTAATTPCADLAHGPGRDHQPEPQLRGGRGLARRRRRASPT